MQVKDTGIPKRKSEASEWASLFYEKYFID